MRYDPVNHHRESRRLHTRDYSSPGAYFVTICTHERECLFGDVVGEEMRLNEIGEIAREEWLKTKGIRPYVDLDSFVVMPNHVHSILIIRDVSVVRATRRVALTEMKRGTLQPRSLGAIIGQFKSITTKRINIVRGLPGGSVWHRNYHDHIIRNEADLHRIRQYIKQNPGKWASDEENPDVA